MTSWRTALPDWKDRILTGSSLIPELPLFPDERDTALRIFRRFRIPDVIGAPTMGEAGVPWLADLVSVIFGSYDVVTHRRMVQEYFVLIPKKNSKSSGAGGIMLLALIMNRRPLAEFGIIAPSKKVADNSFNQAKATIKADPELQKLFHIQDHIRTITHLMSGAKLMVVAADTETVTGIKWTGILIDETHEFAERGNAAFVFTEARGALAARPDGFLIQITTQSKKRPHGVFARELQVARDVRDGLIEMPLLPLLYELPKELQISEAWKDPKYWHCVNPSMGKSVDLVFLENQFTLAERSGKADLLLFASQHLNVEVGVGLRSEGAWAGASYLPRGEDPTLTLETLLERSEVVTVGLDGGGLDDLLGVAVVGRERGTGRYLAWVHAFVTREGLERRKKNASIYDDFFAAGDLELAANMGDDVSGLVRIVERVRDSGLLYQVGADPAALGIIVDSLAAIDVSEEMGNLGGVRQGIALMGAIKTVERKVVDGSFLHGGQSLFYWCAANAVVVLTPTGMRIARDESGAGKIDPLMAMFDAVAIMTTNPPAPRGAGVYAM